MEQKAKIILNNVTKTFGPTKALDDVTLRVLEGQSMALIGKNGAGKSTLISLLTNLEKPDSGEILVLNDEGNSSTNEIGCVYQRSSLTPYLTAAENIAIGNFSKNRFGLIQWAKVQTRAKDLLQEWGFAHIANIQVSELEPLEKKIVEICRVISTGPRVLILDEPTAGLDIISTELLFERMHAAHERGVTSIYISHHLQEIFQVCDVVAVLRDGKLVESNDISAHSIESLVSLMVGSDVNQVKSTRQSSRTLGSGEGKEILSIKGLSVESKLNNLDLKIFEGECVGVTGLDGSGHNQLLEVITGVTVPTSGEMVLQGATISPGNISESIERGIGFCPEDRHFNGYVPALSVAENATMPIHREFRNKFKLINNKARENSYNKLAIAWSIKASGPAQPIEELSGGNQQKVVLARAVSSNPQLLVLNNPTSGVDVSAKESIYKTIADLIKEKQTVLLSSSDISDLEICDRVLVFFGGKIVGEFERPINDAVIAAAVQGKN